MARALSNDDASSTDHNYSKNVHDQNLEINLQFADDLSAITSSKLSADQIKLETSNKLSKPWNLEINKDKTESIEINNTKNNDWQNCKYLGSYLGTEKDITHRKQLVMVTFHKYKSKLKSKKIALNTRLKMFKIYIASVFLYNSEIWTLTKKLENVIDVFQRRMLKIILNIKYPEIISNEKLYEKTNEIPWSEVVRKRRLRWTGHMLRLPDETPVMKAFEESNKYSKTLKKNKKTWKKVVNDDLIKIDKTLSLTGANTRNLAKERDQWRERVVNQPLSCP